MYRNRVVIATLLIVAGAFSAAAQPERRSRIDVQDYVIDAELLTRPGPRLVDGLEQIARTLHPEAFK